VRFLVFQHLSVEHPGVFRDFWKEDGHTWHAVELDEGGQIPELDDFDALFVMGGPMDVWQRELYPWLEDEISAIRRWVVDIGKPYVRICLGHQLLAEALEGSVNLMTRPEVGLAEVELTPRREGPGFPGTWASASVFAVARRGSRKIARGRRDSGGERPLCGPGLVLGPAHLRLPVSLREHGFDHG
jgi:GMP synthase-like glutamine amidotransferase